MGRFPVSKAFFSKIQEFLSHHATFWDIFGKTKVSQKKKPMINPYKMIVWWKWTPWTPWTP